MVSVIVLDAGMPDEGGDRLELVRTNSNDLLDDVAVVVAGFSR